MSILFLVVAVVVVFAVARIEDRHRNSCLGPVQGGVNHYTVSYRDCDTTTRSS